MDNQFGDVDKPMSTYGLNQADDIESEQENYMDALNTIEAASETDLAFQTKREVEKSSISSDDRNRMRCMSFHHII